MAEITPVTEWPDYATNPQGGDPFTQDLNAPYDKVWNADMRHGRQLTTARETCAGYLSVRFCVGKSHLHLGPVTSTNRNRQITPAIGFLYSGMHRRKSAFTMIFQSLFCACACGIQFWVYGYSLYQSHTTGPFIGDLSLAGLHNVLAQPSLANTDIPDILYAAFGFTFVTATAMILAGAMLERGRLGPSMLFLLCWTTFVYYVLAVRIPQIEQRR